MDLIKLDWIVWLCYVQACAKSHIGCLLGRSWLGLYKWLWVALIVTWLVLSIYSTNVSNIFLVSWHYETENLEKLKLNSLQFFTDPSYENISSRDSCGLLIRLVWNNYICTSMFNSSRKLTCLDTKAWCSIGHHYILGKNQETWTIPNDRSYWWYLTFILPNQGFFGSSISVVLAWVLHLKGPVYVSIFKPLSIVIAAAMGVIFLGDALYLGRYINLSFSSKCTFTHVYRNTNYLLLQTKIPIRVLYQEERIS